jgi:hypothetical protein
MSAPPMFPTLAGQGWSVHKKPVFATLVAAHVSGREVRDALYLNPVWSFELTFDGLDGAPSSEYAGLGAQSLQTLLGFFLQAQGQFGSFLFNDPTDNAASNQAIGVGDGATMGFTLVRSLGGFTEPVGWATSVASIYLNGVATPSAGVAAPAASSLSPVGLGSLAATTYFVVVTYLTASGETAASGAASLALAANQVLSVASPAAVGGATGWNVYVSTAAGTETQQNASPLAVGTAWQEPTSGLVAGASPPAANTTGWTLATPNTLNFAGAPLTGTAIAASFAYAFLCRFDGDDLDFEQFMSNLWRAESVKLRSLRAQ